MYGSVGLAEEVGISLMTTGKTILFSLVFAISMGGKALAQTQISAEMLRAACNYANVPSEYQKIAKNMCMGHLRGFFDYHNAMSVLNKKARLFCLPPAGITLDTARTFYMREANAQTKEENSNTPAGILLVYSLGKHFPCK